MEKSGRRFLPRPSRPLGPAVLIGLAVTLLPFAGALAQDAAPPGDALVGQPGCDARDYIYFGGRLLAIAPSNSNVTVAFVSPPYQGAAGSFPESGSATANVVLSSPHGPLGCAVTVVATPWDGTATTGDGDFAPAAVTLTFPAGSVNGAIQTVAIPITADTRYEPDETFTIRLASPNGAQLGLTTLFTATILNDDAAPSISIADVTVNEGSQGTGWTLSATLTLSNESYASVTVAWATADGTAAAPEDYAAVSGTATFDPRTTSKTLSIPIAGDVYYEGDQHFFVNLSTPTGGTIADGQARITLREDDPPTISVNDVHQAEGNNGQQAFVFTVTLQGPSHDTIKAAYQTADCTATAGVDYVAASGVVEFPPDSAAPQTFTVLVNGDAIPEPMEVFKVSLSGLSGAAPGDLYGEGSILGDDGVSVPALRSDFNGDGKNDLLFVSTATGDLQVWYLNGDARIGAPVPTNPTKPSAGNWAVVGVGDFNGDSKPDILWRNSDSGNLSCWYMDGVLKTGGVVITGLSDLTWKVAGTGDFNGDAKQDILWRKDDTGELQMWLMNGTAVATVSPTTPAAPQDAAYWQLQAIGDLNADGKSDLLWRHSVSGAVVYWTMDGASKTTGGYVTPSPIDLAWTLVSVVDVGPDGKGDILAHKTSTGDLVVLHMNGTDQYCGTYLSPASSGPALRLVGPR